MCDDKLLLKAIVALIPGGKELLMQLGDEEVKEAIKEIEINSKERSLLERRIIELVGGLFEDEPNGLKRE